jgi:hypothetical protein
MSWQIQQSVNLGHGDLFWTVGDFYNFVARPNFSLLQHAKIESWPVMSYEESRHSRFIRADADAVTRYTRLAHFKYCITNAVSISDADLAIRKSLDRKVFSELAVDEVISSEKALPIPIGVHLINKNGSLLPTMTGKIALPIANNVELAYHPSAFNWRFPDPGTHSFTVPCHISRKANIY